MVLAQLGAAGSALTPPAGEIGVLVLALVAVGALTSALAYLAVRRRNRRR